VKPALRGTLCASAGLLVGAVAVWLLFCTGAVKAPGGASNPPAGAAETGAGSPLYAALEVAECLRADDFAALAAWVHPQKGVLFTPYSTVEFDKNLSFTDREVALFAHDKTTYLWGVTDGEGKPIQLTPLEYVRRYVSDRDYACAPLAAVGSVLKQGNSVENVAEAFSSGIFVELHIPQVDPKLEGLDWSSLKIVFEEYEGQLKVIALIHSQQTV
jgi:hypothetical protein